MAKLWHDCTYHNEELEHQAGTDQEDSKCFFCDYIFVANDQLSVFFPAFKITFRYIPIINESDFNDFSFLSSSIALRAPPVMENFSWL